MNRILLFFTISVLTVHLYAQNSETKGNQGNFRSLVREGNRLYNDKKIDEAERSYMKALEIDENSNIANFNLGNALYRQQNYEEASKRFKIAADGKTNKMDKARAYHNLGNSYLQQAISSSCPETEQKQLKESIEAYKEALRNNPNDFDTKYNLSHAINMLKKSQDNQDDQGDQDKDKDNQDKDKDKDKDNQDQDKDKDNQDKQQKDPKQNEQQQQQISREDAQRMLDAIAQDEKELLEKLQQQERKGSKKEKEW